MVYIKKNLPAALDPANMANALKLEDSEPLVHDFLSVLAKKIAEPMNLAVSADLIKAIAEKAVDPNMSPKTSAMAFEIIKEIFNTIDPEASMADANLIETIKGTLLIDNDAKVGAQNLLNTIYQKRNDLKLPEYNLRQVTVALRQCVP